MVGRDGEQRNASVVDGIASLMERSLVERSGTDSAPRFRLLETIRQFAIERLAVCGETEHLVARHAAYYLWIAEAHEPAVWATVPAEPAVAKHEAEMPNLRSALAGLWAKGNAENMTWLAGAMRWFWPLNGHPRVGIHTLQRALALPGDVPPIIRAQALMGLDLLLYYHGETQRTELMSTEALHVYTAAGDQMGSRLRFRRSAHSRGVSVITDGDGAWRRSADRFGRPP